MQVLTYKHKKADLGRRHKSCDGKNRKIKRYLHFMYNNNMSECINNNNNNSDSDVCINIYMYMDMNFNIQNRSGGSDAAAAVYYCQCSTTHVMCWSKKRENIIHITYAYMYVYVCTLHSKQSEVSRLLGSEPLKSLASVTDQDSQTLFIAHALKWKFSLFAVHQKIKIAKFFIKSLVWDSNFFLFFSKWTLNGLVS